MLSVLQEYLVLHRSLVLPGLGTLRLQPRPAVLDIGGKSLAPPGWDWQWSQQADQVPASFLKWLAGRLGTGEDEAGDAFHRFLNTLKADLKPGHPLAWKGVGVLEKVLPSSYRFEPYTERALPLGEIPAGRVIHETAEHSILVGDQELSSAQVLDILHTEPSGRSYLLDIGLTLGILALLFTGWYLSEHGLKPGSVGRQIPITPKTETPSYQLIP
ncbi:MAG TPA: hypothetical protein VG870_03495 [Chitinophagaceae bacterium]|nr:hypothetical protein [Chitinophagaceae bacterium]